MQLWKRWKDYSEDWQCVQYFHNISIFLRQHITCTLYCTRPHTDWHMTRLKHTHGLVIPLHYPSLPGMFVLIDFCGVRSFWTAADRPAIHLEFKECLGRSALLLFVLYLITTSSSTLACQQHGWQGCKSASQSFSVSESPNQCWKLVEYPSLLFFMWCF